MDGYTLFDTALGRCALAWSARGVTGVALPGADDAATTRRMARRARPAAPPPAAAAAVAGIVRLLDGEPEELAFVELDLDGVPAFHRRVYAVARTIAPGETRTYGDVAAALGEPGAAQAVGRALGRNPVPIVVPCHRVLAAGGALHGFSAPGGIDTKRRMLAIEGALAPALFY